MIIYGLSSTGRCEGLLWKSFSFYVIDIFAKLVKAINAIQCGTVHVTYLSL